jgi:hypothetical protein
MSRYEQSSTRGNDMTNELIDQYIEDAKTHYKDGMITKKEMNRKIAALEATKK